MDDLLQWLYDLPVSQTVRELLWVFPTLEWIHIYSMVFLITVFAALDLRLMGFAMEPHPRQPLSQLAKKILRLAWISLGVNAVTGTLLFMSSAPDYYVNSAFRIKILLIAVGVAYHWAVIGVVLPMVDREDNAAAMPIGNKLVGGFSLAIWVGVIAASRWIAFV